MAMKINVVMFVFSNEKEYTEVDENKLNEVAR